MLTGWYVGFAIAAGVIVIVVVLVAAMLGLARSIGVRANQIADALAEIRESTSVLPAVGQVNQDLVVVVGRASAARGVLEAMA